MNDMIHDRYEFIYTMYEAFVWLLTWKVKHYKLYNKKNAMGFKEIIKLYLGIIWEINVNN